MNNKAAINGQEYTLLEILPLLDGSQRLILCENGSGKRAVCSESLWHSCVLKDVHTAPVHAHSSAQAKIELFLSVFKGREDVYARRYHSAKTGKSGYTPVCKNEWVNGLCDKKKHKCPECPNREFKPLTAEVVKAHLIGRDPLCRDVAAFTFESVLKAVEAKYVYGLSATPVRKDGHHPIIFMQCGPVRYLVDAKSQAEKRTFSHFVIPRFTRMRLPAVNGIQDIYAGVVGNENRNELLIADTLQLVQDGRTPILLTERKEHAVLLAERLSGKVKYVFLLIGSDKQKDKREKLAALQNVPDGEDVVVVATGKYIGEGFDAPRLDTLLLAMPISWKGTLTQYAGRLHRNYEGKHEVRVYDYVDIHVPTLERMYHKRLKGYAELGYQVKFGAADKSVSMFYDGHAAMAFFEQDLTDAARSIVIVGPYLQKGRIVKLLPVLQKALASGVDIVIHTKEVDSYDSKHQESVREAIALIEQTGTNVHTHKKLQQRYAIVDESIVWYGSVDFLAFGRKDTDILRFENSDIAGELLAISDESSGEQIMIEDVSI